jgi:integral membrane protein (TIGR01906 family)
MKTKEWLIKVLSIVVTVITPLVILMVAIRLLIMPAYARFAYSLPQFPDDPFGFSLSDRLRWSEPSIKYLVNNEDITYLADLTFADGEPIFNERELEHMEDVKVVVTGMRIALLVSIVVLLIITLLAVRAGWLPQVMKAYYQGGWAAIGLIVAIIFFVALNFDLLFTWFHRVFFEEGTWQFFTSDTLIRLFPIRFWRDAFIFVGLQSLVYGGITVFATRKFRF